MKGLLTPQALTEMPQVMDWLSHARGALAAFQKESVEPHSHEAAAALARLNIRLQLEHLHTYPEVFVQLARGRLRLHGWLYEIASGEIQQWEPAEAEWLPLRESAALRATPLRAAGAGQSGYM
jgi:carbonic anhydrase